MSYNLKNKSIVMIAVMFAAMVAFSQTGYAQLDGEPADSQTAQNNQPQEQSDDLFGLDEEENNNTDATNNADAAPQENPAVQSSNTDNNADAAAPEAENADGTAVDDGSAAPSAENNDSQLQPNSLDNISAADVNEAQGDIAPGDTSTSDEEEQTAEAPKSPFERFGNTILSKVDNSLFNQMSNIEKQTTILNLEYKREEVRSRIDALRMQRLKAKQEEAARLKEEEERLKDEENQRKVKEIEAQEKLKKAEMELEKVRQARVLNEYMNEMLVVNQKWVEKNAALQAQVKELRDERKTLINGFEKQIADVRRAADMVLQKSETAKSAHEKAVNSLEQQITNLKKTILQSEETLQQIKNGNAANPFAAGIEENAVDMSNEYAIMDITGKGKDIIAKILNKDGTTFIVHVGSMLKGGEVVTAITDNYIAFNNKGAKSYLYTGGTVREYEPEKSFNGADKTPMAAIGAVNRNAAVRNVRGAAVPATQGSNNQAPANVANTGSSNRGSNSRSASGSSSSSAPRAANVHSLGQGMFVK